MRPSPRRCVPVLVAAVCLLPSCRAPAPRNETLSPTSETLPPSESSHPSEPPPTSAPPSAAGAPSADLVAAGQLALDRKLAKLATRGPKPFDQPDRALRFYLDQRLGEGQDRLPMERLRVERDRLRERERALAARAPGAPAPGGVDQWTWVGPGNIGGRTRAIVIAPSDPDRMFAGGVAGGIWRSPDGGASWNVADDLLLNLAVSCLAMDPSDPDVLYAGTGEGVFPVDSFVQGLGIFKSVDGGDTWSQLPGTVNVTPPDAFHWVNDVVVSPNDGDRVYAGTRTGVWRSDDGGQSWSVVLSNPTYVQTATNSNGSLTGCLDLAIRADTSPDMLFASFGNIESDGLFRTFDGGDTWQAYTVGANQGRMSLALAPSDNDVMYILMADNGLGGAFGSLVQVFRSDDGGDSFTARVDLGSLTGPWLLSNLILATGCIESETGTYSQGWYDNVIAVDPVDPDVVWVGGVDVFRSDDGGVTFDIPGYWIFYLVDPPPAFQIHPDHHAIVFHPDYDGVTNQTMYVGNDGGIYRTENARAATSQEDCPLPGDEPLPQVVWESLNNGYGVTQFYHGDVARQRDVLVGGAQDNGTSRVLAADTPDAWKLVFGGDGGYVAIDPRDADVVYVEYQDWPTIQKSTDGGDTFEEAINGITDDDGIFIVPIAMDQTDPDVLWTGGTRPWRTTDGAGLWELAGPDLAGPNRISAIAIAPSDGSVVYLGFDNGYVARTTNGLDPSPTWQIFTSGLYGGWVSSLAVHPEDPDVAYLTYSTYGVPHVLETMNGGLSWSSIDGIGFGGVPDIPAHWIAVRPCAPEQLYVGTELGVFVSDDAGGTWNPANAGLAHTVVESLDFQTPNTLVAFTHGRGAFLTRLKPCGPHRGVRTWPPMKKP